MPAIIFSVPSGLPHDDALERSTASLSTRGSLASGASERRGASVIACSGQVAAQSPHCTHFASMKRSCGASWSSRSAPSGHAPTHARHIVQVSRLTAIVPNGAPAGSAISRCGTGACRARCSIASAAVVRLSAVNANVAGDAHAPAPAGHDHSAASSAFASAPSNTRKCVALVAQRLRDRVGDAHLRVERLAVLRAPRAPVASTATCDAPCASAASQTSSRPTRRDAPRAE